MANFFRTASLWLKIALICMLIGIILYVIGFATPSWKTIKGRVRTHFGDYNGEIDSGLWKRVSCRGSGSSTCTSYTYENVNDYHRATQAMACIGLIGFTLALVTMLLYLCIDSARRRDFLQGTTLFIFVGALFAVIAFALASSSHKENIELQYDNIGWSMGLAIAGTIFYGVAGIMIILQLIGC